MDGSGATARVYTIYRARGRVPASRRYAVREWVLVPGGVLPGVVSFAGSLDGARAWVPSGAGYRLEREPDDEPEIVETWL